MRKTLLAMLLALALVVVPAAGVFAATTADVTVTATPAFISLTNAPDTWTINGLDGSGVIEPNTTYYANPDGTDDVSPPSATVLAIECNFQITNTSSVATDITVTWGDFTGGGADMTNSNSGTNGATNYGAYSWFEGDLYSNKVIIQDTGSAVGKDALAATTDIKWGVEILTRTDVWTSSTSSTTGVGEHLTITATAD